MMPEIDFSPTVAGWIAFALAFSLGLIVKDILSNFAQGLMFRFGSQFKEGDHVLVDSEDAVIVSIGLRYTKFGITKPDGSYVWRFLPNDRIRFIKIEKIIKKPKDQT